MVHGPVYTTGELLLHVDPIPPGRVHVLCTDGTGTILYDLYLTFSCTSNSILCRAVCTWPDLGRRRSCACTAYRVHVRGDRDSHELNLSPDPRSCSCDRSIKTARVHDR